MRPITAQGVLLAPEVSPWCFHEEEVPSAGLRIARPPTVARRHAARVGDAARRCGEQGRFERAAL